MVLSEVVTNLKMENIAQPNYFPVFGKAIARRFSLRNKDQISSALFGYSEYAWGGEKIKVKTLNVPFSWIGRKITLIVGEKGSFKLVDSNKQFIAKGKVGLFLKIPVEGEAFPFSLFVSLLKARSGTHFTISKQSPLNTIAENQGNGAIAEW